MPGKIPLWSKSVRYDKGDRVMSSYDLYEGKFLGGLRRFFARIRGKKTRSVLIFEAMDSTKTDE